MKNESKIRFFFITAGMDADDASRIETLRNELSTAETVLGNLRRLDAKFAEAQRQADRLDERFSPAMKDIQTENLRTLTMERSSFHRLHGFAHEIEHKLAMLKIAITRLSNRSTTSTPRQMQA